MSSIEIDKIIKLDGPVFVLVGGAIGAGKTTVVNKHLKSLAVLDPDAIQLSQIAGFYIFYDPKKVAQTLVELDARCKSFLKIKKSFIRMGTASQASAALKRADQAKEYGFTTVFLHVEVPVEQAVAQNAWRRKQGDRAVEFDKEYRITRTHAASRRTFEAIKDRFDYSCQFENNLDTNIAPIVN